MFGILEHHRVKKAIKKAPKQVKESYSIWREVVELEGVQALKRVRGYHDEALKGEWMGFRSSRLNLKWRVIYKVEKQELLVWVVELTPHKY